MKTPQDICRDFSQWPERWMGVEEDEKYGAALLDLMRPFVQHLIDTAYKDKKHPEAHGQPLAPRR